MKSLKHKCGRKWKNLGKNIQYDRTTCTNLAISLISTHFLIYQQPNYHCQSWSICIKWCYGCKKLRKVLGQFVVDLWTGVNLAYENPVLGKLGRMSCSNSVLHGSEGTCEHCQYMVPSSTPSLPLILSESCRTMKVNVKMRSQKNQNHTQDSMKARCIELTIF